MECTQRLECTQTQDFEFPHEKECPEQIGFLGICGKTYPVKKGPNKIGRDPHTCTIVLNLNSISRQHAVINVLHKNEFMLMDLDSANKTKLGGKSLQPYVPAPLRNGDTVQFGDIFGIFRLLQEEDDLPMTQAIDIPDTPVPTRHVSKLNMATTVPESPDVSDKDDSFILSSQPKNQHFKNTSNHHFIKPGKTISIQPIGSKKIDNVYWNSSKRSLSLNLNDSTSSLNSSRPAIESNTKDIEENIHEMETQPPCLKANESTDSIYSANTQMPGNNSIHTAETQAFVPRLSSSSIHTAETQAFVPRHSSPSIHTANTQMPCELPSPSIHTLETQIPVDKLAEVCQTEQEEMQFDFYADDKENDNSIYNAKTQCFLPQKENSRHSNDRSKLNTSDENILFDEVDDRSFEEPFESQTILTEDVVLPSNKCLEEPDIPQSQIFIPQSCKRNNRINSDDSSDCEDINIVPTQKIPEVKPTDDDETDCEEEIIELIKCKPTKIQLTDSVIEFQDLTTQVITVNDSPSQNKNGDFEDMLTQVIAPENDKIKEIPKTDVDFEDLPTQVIKEEQADQHFSEELISPFKVPKKTAVRVKKKDTQTKTPKIKLMSPPGVQNDKDDKYYQDTQDIYDDLCTQRIQSPETVLPIKSLSSNKSTDNLKRVSCESPNLDKQSTNKFIVERSPSLLDAETKANQFVSNLSSQEVRDIIGFEKNVAKLSRTGSDSSDLERTPRKVRPFKFMEIDLPNSQEIKTSVSQCSKTLVTESSSDSESENNSESQCTPILFHKKKRKPKKDVKMDLIKKFDAEALPSRVMTRVRKPTAKLLDSESRKIAENILKPTFMTEQDDYVDSEIISENISRIKNKSDKSKNAKDDSGIDIRTDADGIEIKTGDIADVVKRERRKRNENKPDKTVKEEKGTSKKTETKQRSLKNAKNNKVLETTTIEEMIDKNVTQDSTITSKRSGRTTRNKTNKTEIETEPEKPIQKRKYTKKDTKIDLNNEKSLSPENSNKIFTTETEQSKPKRKYTKKSEQDTAKSERDTTTTRKCTTKTEKETTKTEKNNTKTEKGKTLSPEKEVRRSRRAKKTDAPTKSILINSTSTHENSTIYNLSTGSNNESPLPLKRHADTCISEPVYKKTRCNVSLRATPARMGKTQHVLFTAFPYAEVKDKLGNLGAVVVTDVMKCTMILTEQIKRTFKLLCAVGLGKPIVGSSWVQACVDNNTIVDPWLYIIKDEVAEKRFNFSLEKTLIGKRNFLHGYNLSSTPSVLPDTNEMKLIVECSGGTWKSGTTSNKNNWICISTPQDSPMWPDLRARGAILVSTEFILGGVLRQTVDIQGNLLR